MDDDKNKDKLAFEKESPTVYGRCYSAEYEARINRLETLEKANGRQTIR